MVAKVAQVLHYREEISLEEGPWQQVLYTVRCTMYAAQCAVCSVQCAVCSAHCIIDQSGKVSKLKK